MARPHLSIPHPWHGLPVGPDAPEIVHAFIEITPFDVIKYEVDKPSGFLRVDRPQASSALPPTLYGFVPRTYCADRVRALSPRSERGDGDPLDICVISERPVDRPGILLDARVLGGLQMIDGGEADDKIVAVLANDMVWGEARSLSDLPDALVQRLVHYFSTYKMRPGQPASTSIEATYERDAAHAVVRAAMADYDEAYPEA
jgi:inorganic pyrophosphatase